MKYWIESPAKKWMYTDKLLSHELQSEGHQLLLDDDSIILVSICDVVEVFQLEKIRNKYPNNKIIVGGHFAKIGIKLLILFADAVCVGHSFNLFKAKSWQEILSLPNIYNGDDRNIYIDHYIDWSSCPAIQTDSNRFYLWGGVGCKNKCKFCLTSWTEKHQDRPNLENVVAKSKAKIGRKGSVKVISNAYSTSLGDDLVQDMLLRDVLKIRYNGKRKMIRCGIEFATEETRKKNSKPIKDVEIRAAIEKAKELNLDLHFFFIGGQDPCEDWERFLDIVPPDDAFKPRIFFKWTNLEYQQKTPLWSQVKDIRPDYYLDRSFTDWFFQKACHKNKRVRVLPVKYPAHAIWRTCMSAVRDMDEYNKCKKTKNVKDMSKIMGLFNEMKPWDNDLSFLIVPPFDRSSENG